VTDGDKLDWLQGIASEIAENQSLMEQAASIENWLTTAHQASNR